MKTESIRTVSVRHITEKYQELSIYSNITSLTEIFKNKVVNLKQKDNTRMPEVSSDNRYEINYKSKSVDFN